MCLFILFYCCDRVVKHVSLIVILGVLIACAVFSALMLQLLLAILVLNDL